MPNLKYNAILPVDLFKECFTKLRFFNFFERLSSFHKIKLSKHFGQKWFCDFGVAYYRGEQNVFESRLILFNQIIPRTKRRPF